MGASLFSCTGRRLASVALAAAAVGLSACVSIRPNRVQLAATLSCDAGLSLLRNDNRETSADAWSACAIQHHDLRPGTGAGPSVAGYDLAFLEFDKSGKPLLKRQSEALGALLTSRNQNFVVYFVHGWRHDASVKDEDVRRFRIVLSYFRSFIDQRCVKGDPNYCNAYLTGVYLGWPAREIDEAEIPKSISAVAAGLTFFGVRGTSSDVGPPIVDAIAELQRHVRAADPSERSLVLAHSAGGNVVLTGLKPKILARLKDWAAAGRGTPLTLPVWDQAVLINPASEAGNWIAIQEEVRHLANSPRGVPSEIFPADQPPLLISLTATCGDSAGWGVKAQNQCDTATDEYFPLSSDVLLRWDQSRRLTLGHYYDGIYGVTHVALDDSDKPPGVATNYTDALTHSQCDPMPAWLYITRQRSPGGRWDSRPPPGPDGLIPFAGRDIIYSGGRGATVARQYAMAGPKRAIITSSNDPFWNIRAGGEVVADHGGYVSYTLLCSIFQAWNDGIAAPPHTQSKLVRRSAAPRTNHTGPLLV